MATIQLFIQIVTVIGIFWVSFILHNRLKTQEKMLQEYNKMLEGVHHYTNIIDVKKLSKDTQEWLKIKEEKIKMDNEKDREKAIQEIEEKMEKFRIKTRDTRMLLVEEYMSALEIAYSLFYYVPREKRLQAIVNVKEGMLLDQLKKVHKTYGYVGDIPRAMLAEILAKGPTSGTD